MPQHQTHRRVDTAAGDLESLVELGLADPPPEPSLPPPPAPPDEQTGMEQANELMLQSALVDAGVEKVAGDEAVIDALAKLDPKDVEAVAGWLKQKKVKDPVVDPGPRK
jgi:predicted component of type VI protein secretion system